MVQACAGDCRRLRCSNKRGLQTVKQPNGGQQHTQYPSNITLPAITSASLIIIQTDQPVGVFFGCVQMASQQPPDVYRHTLVKIIELAAANAVPIHCIASTKTLQCFIEALKAPLAVAALSAEVLCR